MNFDNLLDKDITLHTANHKYRGVLVDIVTIERSGTRKTVFYVKMGIDEFYLYSDAVVGVTVHGRGMD